MIKLNKRFFSKLKTIGILGCGQMGQGIGQVIA